MATGRTTSVRSFCALAFDHVGLKMEDHVVLNKDYLRPAEVEVLLGDPTKAKAKLGWTAETTLEEMIVEMVEADLARLKRDEHL